MKDVVDNLDNKGFETTVNKRKYNLKNAKKKTFAENNYQKN